MRSRRLITFAAAALLGGAIAAGVSYATIPGPGNVYSACMLKGVGTIRLIDRSLPDSNLMSRCKPSLETEVSWNQAGQQGPPGLQGTTGAPGASGANGTNGVSVTSADEPAGGNCANGGSKFTAASGVTYACNGAPGTSGGTGWSLAGNGGTNPGTDFLGTTDGQPVELRVFGIRALRLEAGVDAEDEAPNLIGGSVGNMTVQTRGATIGGGGGNSPENRNVVLGDFGTVAGGRGNAAVEGATVGGGRGNRASGEHSTIPGGLFNQVLGRASFAAGSGALALHAGVFVWGDSTERNFSSTAANEFSARATGGVRFVSGLDGSGNPSAGVSLAPGSGSWSSLSDRSLKRGFAPIEGAWVLERLANLPISTWSYKAQKPSIRHLGPTAQDFRRAFGLGVDRRHIDSIDSEGVSLAGVKALYELALAQQRELDALKRQVARLQSRPPTAG